MDCPACRKPLIVLELDRIEIDYCTSCKGIWLDAGELELLLEGAEEDNLLSSFNPDKNNKEEKRKCPICFKKMKKVLCGLQGNILIDRCVNNDGLWFDNSPEE